MIKKPLSLSLLLLLLLQNPSLALEAPSPPIEWIPIQKGEQYRIKLPSLTRYSVGDKTIISARYLTKGNELLIKGKSVGTSDLIVWTKKMTKTYTFEVSKRNKEIFLPPQVLFKMLQGLEGIHTETVGKELLIKGEIHSTQDAQKIGDFLKLTGPRSRLLAKPSRLALQTAQLEINAKLKRAGLWNLSISQEGDTLLLEGDITSQLELERANSLSREVWPFIKNTLKVVLNKESLIHVQIFLVEVNKSKFHELGLSWDKNIPNILSINSGSFSGSFSMSSLLKQISSEGDARMIAHPEIALLGKTEAQIFAGGKIPLKLTSAEHSEVEWKEFGLKIKLKSLGVSGRRLRMNVQSEMSSLDWSKQIEGIPAILESSVSSTLDFTSGKPIFLSGLIKSEQAKNTEGLPFLGSIPILGVLFSSKNFRESRSELLVGVLPNVIVEAPELNLKEIEGIPQQKYLIESKAPEYPLTPNELSDLKKEGMI